MSENIRVLLPEEELAARISELGAQISKDYEGESVFLVCILKGAAFFACELAKRITVPVIIDFMATSSYGSGTVSSGVVKIKKDLDLDPTGQNVIIVEDIIDSGNTLNYLGQLFKDRGAKSVRMVTMLDKPDRREVDVHVDYTGFTIPDQFVVGYGLDYDQKYRNLPYIGVVELD
ncbi:MULTISPECIES: hypoxanthine phosphoribosyltransferase [Pseudobutyrivibrio]|uniref:Hypoxanthine phosphoribosyltransferase n=2 Tax=Pseudobutyrivibrio ruminis TaxID=46206 RepID=A0A1H7JBH3_9FIRM|nr:MULTISPECIES: hypoxanthine phosphoribosyltransferase [Pseudobutyrivibrio]MBE5913637.1 hypoxanthine phosphoribosyltransferase [Pseudobutyrivibrio ruminis]SEK71684.1 hypoxanthine phosphoribosyltransferase [Pseudobutyrivibrio ruminis]SET11774.1 hypoxanthine phosphoribosyltransferase [Pseudobutyrivibrio sp. C4]SFO55363.1 hypoxanthine phosphoribosyltransferase [Pseudobutyrivibrio sp. JW11]SOB98327.1 hypoxanthine phosphoribosyltransferase [Pseudobutyrivibrio ruminis DSM 9787]